ncbi:hypothetical protein V492_05678 [Pseudogymnoascus sp. VKM F-4246]|nr:hypothetical protein V492_05678 [Pseudogymnoascus sp. VKM F-4246]
MFSQLNTVILAQVEGPRFQAAVIEPTEQAQTSGQSETIQPPASDASPRLIEEFNMKHSVEQTVVPGIEQTEFGEGSSGGEERQPYEPQTVSVKAGRPLKVRKSAKNPTPAMIKNNRARAIAQKRADRLKQDPRTTDEIYGTVGPVTKESHPHTFSVQFEGLDFAMDADYMGVCSFQNCLERYVGEECPQKQRSAHRPADTLRRILEKNPIPPENYPQENPQVCASWRHEINYPSEGKREQKEFTKWVIRNEQAHYVEKTKNGIKIRDRPELPTEKWYAILAKIHCDHGHYGRDGLFKKVKLITPSISKGFLAEYVEYCCPEGKSSARAGRSVLEVFAGEGLAKTGRPSKGKKRPINRADPDSLSPPAKRPKAHSTEPAMVNAGDEQVPSLRNDYSPAQMGAEFPIAMADPYQDIDDLVENNTASPVYPGSEIKNDSWHLPEDFFESGAEEWQGDDGDWLALPTPDASDLSSLGESIHTQAMVSDQTSQTMIDPLMKATPVQGDTTSHPQSNDAYDSGLSMSLEEPSDDIDGNISVEELESLMELAE